MYNNKMKNVIFVLIYFNLSYCLFANENIIFFHKALDIELRYPSNWKLFSIPNRYQNLYFSDLSQDEIREMLTASSMSPVLFIKKYNEIYYGVNPYIRINARRLLNYPYFYDEDFEIFDFLLKHYLWSLSGRYGDDEIIIDEIVQVNGVEAIHKKMNDYALYSGGKYDERFERTTEYYLVKRYGYIIAFEIQYTKNNINEEREIKAIVDTLRIGH
jgi:hypothetical protein